MIFQVSVVFPEGARGKSISWLEKKEEDPRGNFSVRQSIQKQGSFAVQMAGGRRHFWLGKEILKKQVLQTRFHNNLRHGKDRPTHSGTSGNSEAWWFLSTVGDWSKSYFFYMPETRHRFCNSKVKAFILTRKNSQSSLGRIHSFENWSTQ